MCSTFSTVLQYIFTNATQLVSILHSPVLHVLHVLHCSPAKISNATQLASIPCSPVLHVLYVLHCSPALTSNAIQLASIPCSPVLHVLYVLHCSPALTSNAIQLASIPCCIRVLNCEILAQIQGNMENDSRNISNVCHMFSFSSHATPKYLMNT